MFEIEQLTVEGQGLFNITDFESYVVETDGARFFRASTMALSSGSANEKRCGADQCPVIDLLHQEVRHVRTADRAELPVL